MWSSMSTGFILWGPREALTNFMAIQWFYSIQSVASDVCFSSTTFSINTWNPFFISIKEICPFKSLYFCKSTYNNNYRCINQFMLVAIFLALVWEDEDPNLYFCLQNSYRLVFKFDLSTTPDLFTMEAAGLESGSSCTLKLLLFWSRLLPLLGVRIRECQMIIWPTGQRCHLYLNVIYLSFKKIKKYIGYLTFCKSCTGAVKRKSCLLLQFIGAIHQCPRYD